MLAAFPVQRHERSARFPPYSTGDGPEASSHLSSWTSWSPANLTEISTNSLPKDLACSQSTQPGEWTHRTVELPRYQSGHFQHHRPAREDERRSEAGSGFTQSELPKVEAEHSWSDLDVPSTGRESKFLHVADRQLDETTDFDTHDEPLGNSVHFPSGGAWQAMTSYPGCQPSARPSFPPMDQYPNSYNATSNELSSASPSRRYSGKSSSNHVSDSQLPSSPEGFWNQSPLNSTSFPEVQTSASLRSVNMRRTLEKKFRVGSLYNVQTAEDGYYRCPFAVSKDCGHVDTKSKNQYEGYIDVHLKPYRCSRNGCEGLSFARIEGLLRHERGHDMKGAKYCPYIECARSNIGQGFAKKYGLLSHIQNSHNGLLPDSKGPVEADLYQNKRRHPKDDMDHLSAITTSTFPVGPPEPSQQSMSPVSGTAVQVDEKDHKRRRWGSLYQIVSSPHSAVSVFEQNSSARLTSMEPPRVQPLPRSEHTSKVTSDSPTQEELVQAVDVIWRLVRSKPALFFEPEDYVLIGKLRAMATGMA